MANEPTILWVDDEIELLKPQILFLREKGYNIIEASNGIDALEKCKEEILDIVFLDEQMPGRSGLETLSDIKSVQPNVPIVMITKSEEENLMEDAIGSQISDYLIKPVKPLISGINRSAGCVVPVVSAMVWYFSLESYAIKNNVRKYPYYGLILLQC